MLTSALGASTLWRTLVATLVTSALILFGWNSSGAASNIKASLTQLLFWQKTATQVRAYVTTADASRLFAQDPRSFEFSPAPAETLPVIEIDSSKQFQTIDGFGAALTGSAAYLVEHLPDHGTALLSELFRSDTGLGLSYVRLTIGASDFSLGSYTYDDVAPGHTDPTLSGFSIARDEQLFATAKSIQALSNDVRFMASPWTAPAWMKSSDSLFGGMLSSRFYGTYARYLVAYGSALKARGLALDAMTPQNEPLLNAAAYPSMTLSAAEEASFVKALGPALHAALPDTKLVINDHNWDGESYPLTVMRDRTAARYIAGSAFHCYAGNVAQMSRVREAYPEKSVYLTECSGGAWSPNFGDNLRWDLMNLIIGGTGHWARTVLLGNLALDDADGPTNGGCGNCRGLVTIHADGTITRNVEYYVLEHAAKFVRPGAVRIGSSSSLGKVLPNVAFRNIDGSKVLIVLNAAKNRTRFAVRFGNGFFVYSLPGGAAATFHWM